MNRNDSDINLLYLKVKKYIVHKVAAYWLENKTNNGEKKLRTTAIKAIMKNTIYFFTFLFSFFLNDVFGQKNRPECYEDEHRKFGHVSLGLRYGGIGFGSFNKYNGININFSHYTCKLNGIGITGFNGGTPSYNSRVSGLIFGIVPIISKVNGLSAGIFSSVVDSINGLNLSFLYSSAENINGLNFSLIASAAKNINGINISCGFGSAKIAKGICLSYAQSGDSLYGISIGGLINLFKKNNGLVISGLFNFARESNGFSLSTFNVTSKGKGIQMGVLNKAVNFNGIQLGLINIITNNRNFFRVLPLINFNFRKRSIEETYKNEGLKKADSLNIEVGILSDSRDGKIYKTAKIGSQTWMTENLAYAPSITYLFLKENVINTGIYCYGDDTTLIPEYGMLYTWDAANNSCPYGWHLPTKSDFDTLYKTAGGEPVPAYLSLREGGTLRFNAILGGYLSGSGNCSGIDLSGGLWSSSIKRTNVKGKNYYYTLNVSKFSNKSRFSSCPKVYSKTNKPFGLAVRCIKD